MSADRRPGLVLLCLASALAGLGAWWFLSDPDASTDPRERNSETAGDERVPMPRLLSTADVVPATSADDAPPQDDEPALPDLHRSGDGAAKEEAPTQRSESVQVFDAYGHAVSRAKVAVVVRTDSGDVSVSAYTRANGEAILTLPVGPVTKFSVMWSNHVLFAQEDEGGVDLEQMGDIHADKLLLLQIRTVDSTGLVRPAQRVLYRPLVEGNTSTGWWGATSDAEGWVRLGPYEPDARVQVRAGPRGLAHEEVNDPKAWRTVLVDGTDIDVVIGEQPRLTLEFPGTNPLAHLRITVLNMDTGAAVFPTRKHSPKNDPWTAEALHEQLRIEVLAFDEREGRYARLRDVQPAGLPIEVSLKRGVRVTGRVVTPNNASVDLGGVTVVGRGFSATTRVDPTGRFTFSGLPDGALAFTARVTPAGEIGRTVFRGQATRVRDAHVMIPVGRSVRIVGRVAFPGDEDGSRSTPTVVVSASSPDWQGSWTRTLHASTSFYLDVPAGRWKLTARSTTVALPSVAGALDLGRVDSDRIKLVIPLYPVSR